jgi:hypothetical protein
MADMERETTDLLSRATGAYQSGNSRQALQLLDDAIAEAPGDDAMQRVYLLFQKASWLRESGYPENGAKTLGEMARELDRLPRSGHETEWSMLRMEQGMAAQQQGDFKAATSSSRTCSPTKRACT